MKIAEYSDSAESEIQGFGKDSVSAESDFKGSAKVRIWPNLILPGSVHHYCRVMKHFKFIILTRSVLVSKVEMNLK